MLDNQTKGMVKKADDKKKEVAKTNAEGAKAKIAQAETAKTSAKAAIDKAEAEKQSA